MSIGLDIGSSAVRAAEVILGKDRRTLRRFAQVGLPAGTVRDGEIVNVDVVTAALRRLWEVGGFSDHRVVLGVSGPRVIVRQAEVPALNEEDLRSSLKFDAQDLIPIPMEEACFDFTVLERSDQAGQDGKTPMRILLAAVHRGLLRDHLVAVKAAGLDPV
ncbi:MAG: type IV pilus biogenesis protein PilM, partial [Acidimicrobiales bacterium]